MDVLLVILLPVITHGVTTESFDKKIIVAHQEDEISLLLPGHLLNQTEYVWKKSQEHIATSFGNGSLDIPDPAYTARLNCALGGSLIIKAMYWQDDDQYSVDIVMIDKSRSLIHYQVIEQSYKYIQKYTGPKIVHAEVGESVLLPLEDGIVPESKIEEIDWLTERWVYLAATKVNKKIHILEQKYEGSLSSSPNGSLIIHKVTKKNEGVYRACIFSNEGKIVELMYQVNIYDRNFVEKRTSNEHYSFSENKKISPVFISLHICITFVILSAGCLIFLIIRNKGKLETMLNPKEYNKTRTNHDMSHLESQTQLPNSSLLSV